MIKTAQKHYEQQLWKLGEWTDMLYIMDASKVLADYAIFVEPLHLELTTINGSQEFILKPGSVIAKTLSANLSAALARTDNTGTLKIDYVDPSRGYRDDFLPVELKIEKGSIAFSQTVQPIENKPGRFAARDTDYKRAGGTIRALESFPTLLPDVLPQLPEIFHRLARAASAASALRT